ncbi:MAG: TatD family hydrolase [Bacillota bacterium]|nr:TatD family hydrolase [Bacillota bacterium]
MFFDTHAHLDDKQFNEDIDQVVDRARAVGVNTILNAGITLASSKRSIDIANRFPGVFASVGVHPHDAKSMKNEEQWQELEQLTVAPKVVALGEMGLDYFHNFSEPQIQKEVFLRQLALAKKVGLPIIIHDRDAHQDILDILSNEQDGSLTGVLHCFSGSWEMAQQCLDLGFYISLAGPVTFGNAIKPKEIAKKVPLDRLLIETDCPYLTPHPFRGKRNEPARVTLVAEEIAALREIEVEEIATKTKENGFKLFKIEN